MIPNYGWTFETVRFFLFFISVTMKSLHTEVIVRESSLFMVVFGDF
jgi:hypothetical protein